MQRDHTIDFLKTLAIFGVIVIHTAADRLTASIGSLPWLGALFWGVLFRAAVPVFFMCSGTLFLDPRKEVTTRKLFTRYIPRILAVLTVWGILYHLCGIQGHLYYLQMILLFYAAVPIIRVFIRHAGQTELRYALLFWFLLGILFPTAKRFLQIGGIPGQWALNMTYASIGYGILGYYLKQYPLPPKAGICLFLSGFLFTYAATALLSMKTGTLCTVFLEGMSIGVALMAMGVRGFSLAHPAFQVTSKASFCIFLVHVFFLYRFDFTKSILLQSCLVFLCSLAAHAVLSKIPFIRKWLI